MSKLPQKALHPLNARTREKTNWTEPAEPGAERSSTEVSACFQGGYIFLWNHPKIVLVLLEHLQINIFCTCILCQWPNHRAPLRQSPWGDTAPLAQKMLIKDSHVSLTKCSLLASITKRDWGFFFLSFLFNSLLLNIHLFIDEIIILHQTSRVLSREEEGGVNTSTVLQGAGRGIDGSIQVWLGLGGISFLQFLLLAAGLDLMGLQKTKGKESNLLLTTHWGPASPSPWTVSLQLALVTK